MKTPEQMAEEWMNEEYGDTSHWVRMGKDMSLDAFVAGYQAAKDTYKDAISTYEDVAKQMLEEAVRIMSPQDHLVDADKMIDTCEHILDMEKMVDVNPSSEWISVKDRLPEINKGFIGFAENQEVCNCYRYPNHTKDDSPVFYAQTKAGLLICGLESITHWMPLPKPPEEK